MCRSSFNHFKIVILNAETRSPESEMAEDLMTMTHMQCFSVRLDGLYGPRHYKNMLDRAIGDS